MSWLSRKSADGLPDGMVPAEKIATQHRRQPAAPAPTPHERDLLTQRDRLTEQFTLLQAELGGVFYEMAIRDHIRLDVLTQKAAALQRVDGQLAEVERALRGDVALAAEHCPSCGAGHATGARFCSNCGNGLQAEPAPTTVNGSAS